MQKSDIELNDILTISCEPEFFDESIDKFVWLQLDIFDHLLRNEEANQI